MRIRKIALVAAAVTLPVGLSGCGGGSVEEFCAQYLATAELERSTALLKTAVLR